MITLTNGKTLAPGDLYILVRDTNGSLIDPIQISYTIFQLSQDIPVLSPNAPSQMTPATLPPLNAILVGMPNSTPARVGQGTYWINITIPTTWKGTYRLVWTLVQYQGGVENKVEENFIVQNVDPVSGSFEAPSVTLVSNPITTSKYAPAILYVRELLGDECPERNYTMKAPTPSKTVAGYTDRVGFIWLDSTILRMLDINISKLNSWNPKNFFHWTLDTIPTDWGRCAAVGAAASCLSREASRWIPNEISYSLNGINLDLQRYSNYQSMAQSYLAEFQEWAPLLTANRPFSAGLRQPRWIF